jgi:hypothetical protein
MKMSDLHPAKDFAINFGAKCVVYGRPGSGKTPICSQGVPRPVILMCEPGMLTMRTSTVPTFPAFTSQKIDEFFAWFLNSNEAANFDTLIWDSISQAAETVVDDCLSGKSASGKKRHGQEAYGEMGSTMMGYIQKLYFMPQKHIIMIAKHETIDNNGLAYQRPYFPGKMLPVRVPHLFDFIINLGLHNVPGQVPSPTKAFRCRESFDCMARARLDNINEFEPPDMGRFISKCMA